MCLGAQAALLELFQSLAQAAVLWWAAKVCGCTREYRVSLQNIYGCAICRHINTNLLLKVGELGLQSQDFAVLISLHHHLLALRVLHLAHGGGQVTLLLEGQSQLVLLGTDNINESLLLLLIA